MIKLTIINPILKENIVRFIPFSILKPFLEDRYYIELIESEHYFNVFSQFLKDIEDLHINCYVDEDMSTPKQALVLRESFITESFFIVEVLLPILNVEI